MLKMWKFPLLFLSFLCRVTFVVLWICLSLNMGWRFSVCVRCASTDLEGKPCVVALGEPGDRISIISTGPFFCFFDIFLTEGRISLT